VVKGTAASGARTSSGALTVIGVLGNGVTQPGLAGALGSQQYYVLPVTAAQSLLAVHSGMGTGASELFVQFGSLPTTQSLLLPSVRSRGQPCDVPGDAPSRGQLVRDDPR
jgi:hypothetical protein